MPILIRKIEGEVFNNNMGSVILVRRIVGEIQREDYINMSGFIAYLQNLTEACSTEKAETPLNFGLPNINNLPTQELEFCYINEV